MCGEATDETGAETQEARGGGSRVCPIFQDFLFYQGFLTCFILQNIRKVKTKTLFFKEKDTIPF